MLGSLTVSLLLLAPFGSNPVAQDEVIVYSARHYDSDKLLYQAFEKETGIRVKVTEDKGDSLLARLRDGSAPGDVLIAVDAGNLCAADKAGVFQPTRSEVLEKRIPSHLRHAEGHWFALSMRARCIYYSKERVAPEELSTYEALTDAKWKGRVLIRSSSNVYNQSLVGSLMVNHGAKETEAWARKIVGNMARKPQGGDTDQIRAVAAGEGDVAVANSYYYARLVKSEKEADKKVVEKVGIFFPNQAGRGTHVNVSGAGVLKNSKNSENARKLIEFLAGDKAQSALSTGNNEFPVVPGIAPDPVLVPWMKNKFDTSTNVWSFGEKTKDALRLMDRVGWR